MSEEIKVKRQVAYVFLHNDGRLAVITVKTEHGANENYEVTEPQNLDGYAANLRDKLLEEGYNFCNWHFLYGTDLGLPVKVHKFRVY